MIGCTDPCAQSTRDAARAQAVREGVCNWVIAPSLLVGALTVGALADQSEVAMDVNLNAPRLDSGMPLTADELADHNRRHPPCEFAPPNVADFCVVDLPPGYEAHRTGQHTTSVLSRWWLRLKRALA